MRQQQSVRFLLIGLFLFTTTTTLTVNTVQGYSWGAGSCESGGKAIGGYHLESYNVESHEDDDDDDAFDVKNNNTVHVPSENSTVRCIRSSSLVKAGIHVTIGEYHITSNTRPTHSQSLLYNVEYPIQIYMLNSIFRGVLIRLSSSSSDQNTTSPIDLTDMLYTTDPLLQMATTVCSDPTVAVGVTHRTATDKDLVYATLRFDSNSSTIISQLPSYYNLEITVVGMNNELGSLYAYSSFELQVSNTGDDQDSNNTVEDGANGAPFSDVNITTTSSSDEGSDETDTVSSRENGGGSNSHSSSLLVGFTTLGGACIAGVFAILFRSKLRQFRTVQ